MNETQIHPSGDNTTSAIHSNVSSTINNSNITVANFNEITGGKIAMGIGLCVIVCITFAGNLIVLLAIKRDKRLQTLFNYYIVNLAVTDMAVAVTAMSFYTIDNILGYWPFGEVLCGLWIFCDYGMTFASVFTLIVISVDRFWSVTWAVNYQQHNTRRKCLLLIFLIW
jgi:hypothetical protein